jgi:GT2 family glycosyltransferase
MISVIIPTYNRIDLLKKCIDNLDASVQFVSSELYEVIVTDDSNNSISKEYIETYQPQIKWVKGPGKGPAANRNNGANYAGGGWLVFIDDDCIPDSNLLKAYAEAINDNPGVLAFEGAIFPDNWELMKKDMAECPVNTSGGCFWSANICVEKNLFKSIGGFNEKFLIAAQEDQEIYLRISEHTNVVFCKNCIVIHPVRYRKLAGKIKRIPLEIRNWILFARLKRSWVQIFLDGSTSQIKACIRTIQRKQFGLVTYHLCSLAYLIPGIILSALQQHGRQKI